MQIQSHEEHVRTLLLLGKDTEACALVRKHIDTFRINTWLHDIHNGPYKLIHVACSSLCVNFVEMCLSELPHVDFVSLGCRSKSSPLRFVYSKYPESHLLGKMMKDRRCMNYDARILIKAQQQNHLNMFYFMVALIPCIEKAPELEHSCKTIADLRQYQREVRQRLNMMDYLPASVYSLMLLIENKIFKIC